MLEMDLDIGLRGVSARLRPLCVVVGVLAASTAVLTGCAVGFRAPPPPAGWHLALMWEVGSGARMGETAFEDCRTAATAGQRFALVTIRRSHSNRTLMLPAGSSSAGQLLRWVFAQFGTCAAPQEVAATSDAQVRGLADMARHRSVMGAGS